MPLVQLRQSVEHRTTQTARRHDNWPCQKGCSDCCRSLAAAPRVSAPEWSAIAEALRALSEDTAAEVRLRIRASANAPRPVTCPLLDLATGACLIYDARPIACRAYGFYAERHAVLGCGRIESIAQEDATVVWGNHAALDQDLRALGPTRPLADWFALTGAEQT